MLGFWLPILCAHGRFQGRMLQVLSVSISVLLSQVAYKNPQHPCIVLVRVSGTTQPYWCLTGHPLCCPLGTAAWGTLEQPAFLTLVSVSSVLR